MIPTLLHWGVGDRERQRQRERERSCALDISTNTTPASLNPPIPCLPMKTRAACLNRISTVEIFCEILVLCEIFVLCEMFLRRPSETDLREHAAVCPLGRPKHTCQERRGRARRARLPSSLLLYYAQA